jgi:hypothetical protein
VLSAPSSTTRPLERVGESERCEEERGRERMEERVIERRAVLSASSSTTRPCGDAYSV